MDYVAGRLTPGWLTVFNIQERSDWCVGGLKRWKLIDTLRMIRKEGSKQL